MSTARTLYEQAAKSNDDWRLMTSIRQHEGYEGMPYEDSLGKPTIGVGCLLPLSEDESMLVAYCRMSDGRSELRSRLYKVYRIALNDLAPEVERALVEMSFQLGVPRFMGFRKMLAAISKGEWSKAADEALDSKWARQTPVRAEHVAEVLRSQIRPDP